jgi:putative endonuclease
VLSGVPAISKPRSTHCAAFSLGHAVDYVVYILQSERTGKTYIGQTSDIERRLQQHNDPDCKFTLYTKRNKGPWKLIHTEVYATRSEAIKREKKLKTGWGREWIQEHVLKPNETGGC